MNKIRVIDLLNKIANGNIPKRIIYDKYVYIWNNKIENYEREIDANITLNWDYIAINCLNEPVEILEEEKKIPERVLNAEVFDVPKLNNMELSNIVLTNKEDIKIIKDTLNKVLDYLKSKGDE